MKYYEEYYEEGAYIARTLQVRVHCLLRNILRNISFFNLAQIIVDYWQTQTKPTI